MSPELIVAVAGIVLSLAFEYIPGVHTWYNALEDNKQKLIMLLALAVTVAGAYGLSCAAWLAVYACTSAGIQDAVFGFVLAAIANQTTHRLLPKAGNSDDQRVG